MITGSIEQQCAIRLENLFNNSHEWLLKASYNITKNKEEAEDLVGELYEYLHIKQNPKLFYGDSYNLLYLHRFLGHRWINKIKKNNRVKNVGLPGQDYLPWEEQAEIIYDEEKDLDIQRAYAEVMNEIQRLKKRKGFAAAMLYEMYWMSDDTLQEVADKIGISKSTVFLSIKRIRLHLKRTINNPFPDES